MSTGNGGPTGGGGVQTKKGKGKVKVVYDWEGNPTVVREGSGANTGGVVKAKSSNIASNDDSKSSTSTTTSSSTSGGDSSKKPGGTLSYKDSYTDAVASKWESKGGYAAYEKAAKDWNKKKYGTTEPTSTAKAGGITKKELASKHKVDSTKFTESLTIDGKKTDVKDLGPEYTSYGVMAPKPRPTDNAANTSLSKTIGAANSDESLLGGVQTRREKRRQRQDDRIENRRQRQDDRQGLRSRKKWARGESKKSTTTGLEGIKAESERNLKSGSGGWKGGQTPISAADAIKKLNKKGKQILGSERPY